MMNMSAIIWVTDKDGNLLERQERDVDIIETCPGVKITYNDGQDSALIEHMTIYGRSDDGVVRARILARDSRSQS